jgi:hypothetical protein
MNRSTKEYVPNEAAAERRAKARKALNYQEKHPEIDAQQPKNPRLSRKNTSRFSYFGNRG